MSASIAHRAAVCVLIALAIGAMACRDDALDEQADRVCGAVDEERFAEALSLSIEGASARGAGRRIAECRCIAQLSVGDREGCTTLLSPLLASQEAGDWLPHPVLTKLVLRTWQAEGSHELAARLATRAAPRFRDDLDLLQLEVMLRSSQEDEVAVLEEIELRLQDDASWIPQRLVLALGWNRRSRYDAAIRVLGETPPAIDHPLALPWYESRIQAQAASGDLEGVQRTFEGWRETGWDPVDLDARYALRLSTDQLRDPRHDTIDLLREAIATQDELRDRNIVWGLHRRLIAELLAAGRPKQAVEAYDAAIREVELPGVTREELERAVLLAEGGVDVDAPAVLRFVLPETLTGGRLLVSPGPDQAPDAGYRAHPIAAGRAIEITTRAGIHARRWVLRDADGRVRGSGSIWPAAGHTTEVEPQIAAPTTPASWQPATRAAGDGRRRVFAILADCGDWRLTEYLRARGELPFHDHLFETGYRAVLESRPAFTAAAMQALVWPAPPRRKTGLGWIHHLGLELAGLESVGANPVGFLSWVLPERPNLFETLGSGPLVTANMLLAHGRIEAGRHAELVGPHGERAELPSQSAYRMLDASEIARHPALRQDADTRKFAETIAAEMDAAEQIARAGEVDFLFLRLEALDLVTHAHFGPIDGRGQDDGAGPLLSTYRYIDERLAALHALLDEDDWLVFLSDHGIRSSMQHEEDALFVVEGRGVPPGRAEGRPPLRGVPRSLAAMLSIDTHWPDTQTTPWLEDEIRAADQKTTLGASEDQIAAHR
jgi:hypothetical protein